MLKWIYKGYGAGGGGATLDFDFTAGEDLLVGQLVYGDSAGGLGRVKKAVNATVAQASVLGVVTQAALTGATAKVRIGGQGTVTFTGGAPAVGDFGKPVYASAVAGQATLTPPGAGLALVRVGYLASYGAADCLVDLAVGDVFQQ